MHAKPSGLCLIQDTQSSAQRTKASHTYIQVTQRVGRLELDLNGEKGVHVPPSDVELKGPTRVGLIDEVDGPLKGVGLGVMVVGTVTGRNLGGGCCAPASPPPQHTHGAQGVQTYTNVSPAPHTHTGAGRAVAVAMAVGGRKRPTAGNEAPNKSTPARTAGW